MSNIPTLLLDPDTIVAVVGATDSPSKYGSIIYRDLKGKGIAVVGVNPGRETVDGDRAYPTVADLPEAPTIVNFVVPPEQTLAVLRQCRSLGYMTAWVQPGAESPEVVAYLEEQGFDHLVGACIMVEARPRG